MLGPVVARFKRVARYNEAVRRLLLAFGVLAAPACGPSAGPANVVNIPPTPIASATVSSSPPSIASASSAAQAQPSSSTVKEIPFPLTKCLVDATAPTGPSTKGPSLVGIRGLSLEGVQIASVPELGKLRRVKLAFEEGSLSAASVDIDAEIVSARGTVPLRDDSSADLDLFPRTRVLREGWLDYQIAKVASVRGAELEPHADLPPWLTPSFATTPFFVPCAELTPFGAPQTINNDAALLGTKVALENEQGKKVAMLDAPKEGLPVQAVATHKGRTKVRFEASSRLIVEAWAPSRQVKTTTWGGLGYGTGHGRLVALPTITCDGDVPLHVRVRDVTYAWGTLHAKQSVQGQRAPDGSFALLRLGGHADHAPFVPSGPASACLVAPPKK